MYVYNAGGVLIAGNLNVPLVWLVASVVAWMFTSASCVAVMEKLPWHDALYFVGSTLTTGVGAAGPPPAALLAICCVASLDAQHQRCAPPRQSL
jgi:hypothetical protein